MDRIEFLNYASKQGKEIDFVKGSSTSKENQQYYLRKVKETFDEYGYVVCKYSGERIYDLKQAHLLIIPINEKDAYVVTVHHNNVKRFKEELSKPKKEHQDPGVVTKNIKWGDDCLVSLGLIQNHFVSLPLFYVEYPNEEILKGKLEQQITEAILGEKIYIENIEGTTLEGMHTLKGEAPYTNFLYIHNAELTVEKTAEGIVIRMDFIPAKKPEGSMTKAFSVSGIIEHDPFVDHFREGFEEVGATLIRFGSPENAGDHIYLVCDRCVFINLMK
jgi:hypothetical protein